MEVSRQHLPTASSESQLVGSAQRHHLSTASLPDHSLQSWYMGDDTSSTTDPARKAYEEAVELFKRDLTQEECKKIWLKDKSTIFDVQKAIQKARAEYEGNAKKSKVGAWLSRCASRMVYYGNIMDVLIQGCPDYASLVWGAFKFLFLALVNREELLSELSKSITRIADVLPRAELLLILYPTDRMRTALSGLYAKIIQFVQSAVKYYKSSSFTKSIAAIIKPFSLSFKYILEDITEASRRIDELANAALKAEIRDLHIQVKRLTEITLLTQSVQSGISLDLSNQRLQYENAQLELIQSLPLVEGIPHYEDSLHHCRSMTRRRRVRIPASLSSGDMKILKTWLTSACSSVLIGEAHGIKTSSRDFAVELLDMIRKSQFPVVWALPVAGTIESSPAIEEIFASLVLQLLKFNPSALSGRDPISVKHFKSATTLDQWQQLLRRSARGLKCMIIVVDLKMVQSCLRRHHSLQPEEFLEQLFDISGDTGGIVKIIALTWKLDNIFARDAQTSFGAEWISTDPGPKKVRLMRTPKFRAAYSAKRQKIAHELRDGIRSLTNSEDGPT